MTNLRDDEDLIRRAEPVERQDEVLPIFRAADRDGGSGFLDDAGFELPAIGGSEGVRCSGGLLRV